LDGHVSHFFGSEVYRMSTIYLINTDSEQSCYGIDADESIQVCWVGDWSHTMVPRGDFFGEFEIITELEGVEALHFLEWVGRR
jgi:hypothetical protein